VKAVKKWKGKDWFNIFAPEELGKIFIAQTPATDPKTLLGRSVIVSVADILGDDSKYYMKIRFVVNKIDGKNLNTTFGGFECMREHVIRFVRKNMEKLEHIMPITTKDKHKLRIKSIIILNSKAANSVKKNVRQLTTKIIEDYASKYGIYEFLRRILTTEVQMRIKNEASKIYPVRFAEIEKIKVLKSS